MMTVSRRSTHGGNLLAFVASTLCMAYILGGVAVPSLGQAQGKAKGKGDDAAGTKADVTASEPSAEDSKSSKEALARYAQGAGYQNNKQFDLAAEEWKKFLKDHADDPKSVEARYNLAVCQLQQSQFAEAIDELGQVVATAPADFARWQDAYLNLGWAQYSLALQNQPERFKLAADTFQTLLDKYPEGEFRDQALFFGGESLYLEGKRDEAAASYQELVTKHADSELLSGAMYALGVTYEELGKHAEARQVFDRFLEKFTDHELHTEVRMRKAETLLPTGEFAEAEKIFAEVAQTKDFKAVDHARYRQAFCAAELKRYDEAAKIFESITKEMPDSAYATDAAMAAGRAYYFGKNYDLAMTSFQQIAASNSPHAPEAGHWLARILLDRDQPQKAREVVASVLPGADKHPFRISLLLDDADALYEIPETKKESVATYFKIAQDHADHKLAPKSLYNAAYGAMETGDYANGLSYAEQFFAKYPNHALQPEVQKVVAECKLQLGDHDDAAKAYGELAKSGDPEGTRFELRRGLSLYLKKNYAEAITVMKDVFAKSKSPDEKGEAAYWTGLCHAGLNQHDQAVTAFQASLQANPDWKQTDEVLLNLGRALRRVDKIQEAKTTLEQLLTRFPKSAVLDQGHYRLAEVCYGAGDFSKATEHYTRVIEDWKDSKLVPFSIYGRGWSLLRGGKGNLAVDDFTSILEKHQDHELYPQSLYARAMARHQIGELKLALEDVDAFLKTNPDPAATADARYVQALCQIGLKDVDTAVTTLTSLLKDQPNYSGADKVLYEMAWAHKNAQREEQAMTTFQQLIERSPKSTLAVEARYHVAENYYAKKEYAEAAKEYEQAFTSATTVDLKEKSAYKLGWSHYQLGDFEPALAAFEQQISVADSTRLAADAEFMRGECLFKLKKYEEALGSYQTAIAKPSQNETMQVLTFLHAAQASAQLKQWEASLKFTEQLTEKYPKSPYLAQANYERAWAQRNLGQLDPAFELFNTVAENSRNELGARARFMMGEILFEKKDFEKAVTEFRRVIFGYGAEKAPEEIKRWQAKSAFEAGRCDTVLAGQQQDPGRKAQYLQRARGFFQYVADKHEKSEEATLARQQLQRLGA